MRDIIYVNYWGGWVERRGMVMPPPMKFSEGGRSPSSIIHHPSSSISALPLEQYKSRQYTPPPSENFSARVSENINEDKDKQKIFKEIFLTLLMKFSEGGGVYWRNVYCYRGKADILEDG